MSFLIALSMSLLLIGNSCFAQEPAKQLSKPPKLKGLKFSGVDAGFPPAPAGRTNEKVFPLDKEKEVPGSLTSDLRNKILTAVPGNPRAQKALGKRYTFISMQEVPEKRGQDPTKSEDPYVVAMFFSYDQNSTIKIHLRGTEITDIQIEKGKQPHAGVAEEEYAIQLAMKDKRLKDKVKDLKPGGMLIVQKVGRPGYGHRVMYVTFAKEYGLTPLYAAVVDLNERKVLTAGDASSGKE